MVNKSEVIDVFDKPGQVVRHPLTRYLCCKHFGVLMGNTAEQICNGHADLVLDK